MVSDALLAVDFLQRAMRKWPYKDSQGYKMLQDTEKVIVAEYNKAHPVLAGAQGR